MRINYISDVIKIIIFATTIIVVCVLCSLGFRTAKEGTSAATSVTSRLNTIASEYSSIDKSVYDGCTILGSELVHLIKKSIEEEEYLAIVVRTLESSRTDYNYVYDVETNALIEEGTKVIEDSKAYGSYINRSAQFLGTVKADKNNNIICIWFEQLQ